MSKIWLPLKEQMPQWKVITVTENGFTMPVYVPIVSDRQEQKDLDDYALGNTQDQLRHKKPKPVGKASKSEIAEALKDYRDWFRHRQATGNNRVFRGGL